MAEEAAVVGRNDDDQSETSGYTSEDEGTEDYRCGGYHAVRVGDTFRHGRYVVQKEAIRRSNDLEEDDMETLRKVSRQEYLKKREQKKLEELRDDIEDEHYLFDGVMLTEVEYRELR